MAERVMITVPDLCEEMHKGREQVYAWARRKVDPLPVRYIGGERYGAILVSELDEWWRRNGELMGERS